MVRGLERLSRREGWDCLSRRTLGGSGARRNHLREAQRAEPGGRSGGHQGRQSGGAVPGTTPPPPPLTAPPRPSLPPSVLPGRRARGCR